MVIIAAVDKTDRAKDVVNEAESLSDAFNEKVHIVHVLSRSEFIDLERTSVNETGTAVEVDRVREIAADIAAECAVDLDTPFETVGLVGDPAPRVVEYAADVDARYLVTAGRKRSPTGKALFGSTAQSMLLNADCPVVMSVER